MSGAGQLGFWETGEGGTMGEGWVKSGQFISNLRRRRTIPVTAGGCQVSESGAERGARGARGAWGARGQGEQEEQRKLRHVYMQM